MYQSTDIDTTTSAGCVAPLPTGNPPPIATGYGGLRSDLDTLTVQHVRSEMRLAIDAIVGRIPFAGSTWARECAPFTNTRGNDGLLRRLTLLTGGVVYLPFESVRKALRLKAEGLDQGILFTDVEIAHNGEGIRLFFELDYRARPGMRLPDREAFLSHIHILQACVSDCFPSLRGPELDAHVATCDPKVKNGKDSHSDILAWGAHVVFPKIVVRTSIHKRLAALADSRMGRMFPEWKGVVDPCIYRTHDATLRPLGSHKARRCVICSTRGPSNHALTGLVDESCARGHGIHTTQSRIARVCDCVRGYRLEPSVYRYNGFVEPSGRFVPMSEDMSTYSKLELMSIVPGTMGGFMDAMMNAPDDMGDHIDAIPDEDGVVFRAEKQIIRKNFSRRRDAPLAATNRLRCFQVLTDLMSRISPMYQYVAIDSARYAERSRSILVLVKAKGSRYCMFRGGEHTSNRVYFVISLRGKPRIEQRCFDNGCRQTKSPPPGTSYLLTYPEIVRFHDAVDVDVPKPMRPRLVRVGTTSNPKPEPCGVDLIATYPHDQACADTTREQKRILWEHKVQLFRAKLSTHTGKDMTHTDLPIT